MNVNMAVVTNQEEFFNTNATLHKKSFQHKIFYDYANKEQLAGLAWLSKEQKILDYGVGTATSIDRFFEVTAASRNKYEFYGVDIAQVALDIAKQKYPEYSFYKIEGNKIPQLQAGSIDAAYMLHVLHHSHNHEDIFKEIYRTLKPGGKLLINDLTSRNPIIKFGRFLFASFPILFKNQFPDDLVVDGKIPDKYPLDIPLIVSQLEAAGFYIQEHKTAHLFFFIFDWIDRVLNLSKYFTVQKFYKALISFEDWLLETGIFDNFGEMICLKCIKKKNSNLGHVSGDYSKSFNNVVFKAVGASSTVLDVGCWTGNLGGALIDNKNCVVDGIDFRDDVLEEARLRGYRNLFKINFDNIDQDIPMLSGKTYDYIIFADVLEHLLHPDNVLKIMQKHLNQGGQIVVSLPNVAFVLNRILLLLGKWEYKEFGTLDKTHLKFFTINSAKKLLEKQGYDIVKVFPYNQFGVLKYIEPFKNIFPSLLAYQVLFIAKLPNKLAV
ncbi:methyltransferase domain-containing protein [candidate division WWE3 bacterium]|nr:methyltransferase domain-containing protein [candidate division WWE3 bacterium]